MGTSHTIHSDNGFEISIYDNRDGEDFAPLTDVSLSIGTGFTSYGEPSVNVEIPLTLPKLEALYRKLGKVIKLVAQGE